MHSVTAFAPATVSNVACGFDTVGFAIDGPGDEVTAHFGGNGVSIDGIAADGGRLPRDPTRNTAGIAARALLAAIGEQRGVALMLRKGLPLASGLGGSAASAAAAVVAVDALLEARTPTDLLIACALEGERLGSGSAHPDNVVPAICGGLILVRDSHPLDFVRLPVPEGLTAVVVHPVLEIETAAARALLGDTIPLVDGVRQWANLGALVDALHRSDFDLLSRALVDAVAEPRRAGLVPGLYAIKHAAVDAGALGAGLSGSGPSFFALCRNEQIGDRVAAAMTAAVSAHIPGVPQTYVSAVGAAGARVVATCVS